MKACAASGGIAAGTRTSIPPIRRGCRCCLRSTASSVLPMDSSITRNAKNCEKTAASRPIAAEISQVSRSMAVPLALAMPVATEPVMGAAAAATLAAAMAVMSAAVGTAAAEVAAVGAAAAGAVGISVVRSGLRQLRVPQLVNDSVIAKPPHDLLAAPLAGVARDQKQVVGGGRIMAAGQCRGRGHADRRNLSIRALEPHRRMNVIVAVQ